MFACVYSLTVPVPVLTRLAADFTPRFEVLGPLVLLDVGGLSRLIGTPREIGEELRRSGSGAIRIAIAPTPTAAALLALGGPGLTVVTADDQPIALAPLPVTLLSDFDRFRCAVRSSGSEDPSGKSQDASEDLSGGSQDPPLLRSTRTPSSPSGRSEDRLLQGEQTVPFSGGWMHPRNSHAAARPRRRVFLGGSQDPSLQAEGLLPTLRRWGIKTLGELAALPPGDVYERLGGRGVLWQRLARGEDFGPLVPWVPEDPVEASLELEWPIEGLEPLSFVLARLLEPLSERLEREHRGAVAVHISLRLVDRTTHARSLQVPTPMRDARTLRTLLLLHLETHPPAAAIDRVQLLIDPTPARVTQWTLFDRAQPSPEQVSTLIARLTALVGETHVGSPQLVDTWRPGAFAMTAFVPPAEPSGRSEDRPLLRSPRISPHPSAPVAPFSCLRRFRLPIPTRVQVQEGRPVRVMTDRSGVSGGPVVQAAGPWRTSGEWWNDAEPGRAWDRDEWDVALADGTVYRLYVERAVGQWFLDGIVD